MDSPSLFLDALLFSKPAVVGHHFVKKVFCNSRCVRTFSGLGIQAVTLNNRRAQLPRPEQM